MQPPSIPYPIKTSKTLCKSLKDELTISPTNPSIDQPNNLTSSNFNLIFGNELIPKQNNMTRLLYHNLGSLGISTNSHNIEVICEAMFTHEIDISSLVETNTHWKHDKSLPKFKQVLKQFWSRANISTSKTIAPWKSIYKSGESVTIFTPNIVSSVISTGEDEEGLGCLLYITYGCKNKKRVTIISAYRTLFQTTTKAYLRHIHNNGIF